LSAVVALLVSVIVPAQLSPATHLGTLTEGLQSPARIAVTASGLLVADTQAGRIVRFDAGGAYIGNWSVSAGPVGIGAHPDGRMFVSRRDDGKVAVHDAAFTFLRFLGAGIPMVNFVNPADLAVDPATGRIYVVDSGGDRFYVFNSDESLALIVGMRGARVSEFKYPAAIAVDSANHRIFVADQDNFRIQVFSTAGVFLRSFGYRTKYLPSGGEEGWMPRSAGLAVTSQGNILVSDAVMGTVRVFNPTGTELGKIISYATNPGELRTPCDIAIDAAGRLVVANSGGGGVELYTMPSGLAPTGEATGANLSATDAVSAGLRTPPGWDPPHMLDDVICGRCHDIDAQPGGHLGLVEGQANLCFSCHTGGGQAADSLVRPTAALGMSHAWGVPAINAAAGSVGPAPGGVMAAYLDGGNIKCATCHQQHNNDAASPFLRAEADSMCRECHASHTGHTPAGSWQPSCTECHVAHDPVHRNLSLVSGSVRNRTLGLDKPVVLTARTGSKSFDDGDPAANDGICQVCHTATSYHKHDGTGASHHNGADCISCHPHDAGFLPAGGGSCTACHASAQGSRRAVVGEFPVGDAHAHYGAQLDDDACLVCHSVDTHMDGNVDLIDPDDSSLYTFAHPAALTSDPDLSNFCAGCHDANGAARLATPLDPFGNGNTPPDVATRFLGALQWNEQYGDFCFGTEGTLRAVNSHHDISNADQAFSGAKIECLNCHGAHNPSASQPMADPLNTLASWTGTRNEFCLACHAGGIGPADPQFPSGVVGPTIALRGIDSCGYQDPMWYVDYTWTNSHHGPNSKRAWNGYSGAPEAELDCTACHDPHGSYSPTNTPGNPYMIRDAVDGRPFVDDGVRPGAQWTGPPWNTFGAAKDVKVGINGLAVDWGGANSLCIACHADWEIAYDWHSYCNACQSCHGHGMAWGEADWVDSNSDTSCQTAPTLRSTTDTSSPIKLRIHQRSTLPAVDTTSKRPPWAGPPTDKKKRNPH